MYQNGSLNIPDEVQVHPVAEKNFPSFYVSHSCICMDYYRIQWKVCLPYLRLAFDHLGFGSAIYFCIPVIVFNIYILIHWAGFFSRFVLLRLLVYFLH